MLQNYFVVYKTSPDLIRWTVPLISLLLKIIRSVFHHISAWISLVTLLMNDKIIWVFRIALVWLFLKKTKRLSVTAWRNSFSLRCVVPVRAAEDLIKASCCVLLQKRIRSDAQRARSLLWSDSPSLWTASLSLNKMWPRKWSNGCSTRKLWSLFIKAEHFPLVIRQNSSETERLSAPVGI